MCVFACVDQSRVGVATLSFRIKTGCEELSFTEITRTVIRGVSPIQTFMSLVSERPHDDEDDAVRTLSRPCLQRPMYYP